MKKIIFLFLSVILFMYSCTKEEEKTTKQSIINKRETMRIDPIELKIQNFIQRMDLVRENPEYEGSSDWNYSANSTVWYIEAALNYTYSIQWQYSGDNTHSDLYDVDSSFTFIDENTNGTFNIVSIQMSYDSLAENLESQYQNNEANSKFLVVSDIIDQGVNNNQLSLKQCSIIGMADQTLVNTGWFWGYDFGRCDATNAPLDATDVIERMNSVNASIIQDKYYTDVSTTYIYPYQVMLSTGSNPFGFVNSELYQGPDNTCMDNSMLNYYYNYFSTFANRFTPQGNDNIFCDLNWDITVGSSTTGIHYVKIKYGYIHIGTATASD